MSNRQPSSFVSKFHASNKKTSSCPPIVLFSWATILLWVGFLVYCVHYGLITSTQISVMVENADILTSKKSLRSGKVISSPTDNSPESGTHTDPNPPSKPANPTNRAHFYTVFSTDCTAYQDWQSIFLFHSALRVKQPGIITRIASGCTEAQQEHLTTLYKKLYGDYCTVHFTPDFKKDAQSQRSYDFYNKPWGIKHWLELANPPIPEDSIIALLDPDMVFLRPLTPAVAGSPHIVRHKFPMAEMIDEVVEGKPVSQTYGLGAPWARPVHRHFNRTRICGADSPCLKDDERFAETHYSVGPPYVMHKKDFVKIALSWTRLVPRVYADYPYLLAEMYAFSMAAAHEELPNLQVEHYMVSNVDSSGEGWPWIDDLPQVCVPPSEDGVYYAGHNLPTVAHHCQTYRIGEFMFTKRRVPKNIFSCEHPLLQNLPATLPQEMTYIKNDKKETHKNAIKAKRNAFMVCTLYDALNAALKHYKSVMCAGQQTNMDNTYKIG